MQIRDMRPDEVNSLLDRAKLGRLACSRNGQPHIAPLSFVREGSSLFAFTTVGRKIDWMRENPHVCVEFEDIRSAQSWEVVLIEGSYEELADSDPRCAHAFSLLQKRPMWWEPGYVHTHVGGADRALEPVYFRIAIASAKGRCAIPE